MNITTIQPRVVEILLTAHVFKTHVDCRGQVRRRHLLGTAINIQIYSFADHLCVDGVFITFVQLTGLLNHAITTATNVYCNRFLWLIFWLYFNSLLGNKLVTRAKKEHEFLWGFESPLLPIPNLFSRMDWCTFLSAFAHVSAVATWGFIILTLSAFRLCYILNHPYSLFTVRSYNKDLLWRWINFQSLIGQKAVLEGL